MHFSAEEENVVIEDGVEQIESDDEAATEAMSPTSLNQHCRGIACFDGPVLAVSGGGIFQQFHTQSQIFKNRPKIRGGIFQGEFNGAGL